MTDMFMWKSEEKNQGDLLNKGISATTLFLKNIEEVTYILHKYIHLSIHVVLCLKKKLVILLNRRYLNPFAPV